MNKVALFLILAVATATACYLLLGVLLRPARGVSGSLLTMIPGGVSGAIIAVLYFSMFRKIDGA